MPQLSGWRFAAICGGLLTALGLATYPIILSPMMNSDSYKQTQARTRAGIIQSEIQPGNMKVWTDPFDRPEKMKKDSSV